MPDIGVILVMADIYEGLDLPPDETALKTA